MSELEDADIIARLSALPEHSILGYFWMMSRSGADPLTLLMQLTRVVVQRPADWNPADIRREHERGDGVAPTDKLKCFACTTTQRRLYVHHVVEVFHGGSNTPRNKVAVCFLCHKQLHPWLTDEPPPRHVNGFESLYEIARRIAMR